MELSLWCPEAQRVLNVTSGEYARVSRIARQVRESYQLSLQSVWEPDYGIAGHPGGAYPAFGEVLADAIAYDERRCR